MATRVDRLLDMIEAQVRLAREALTDEHEGNFTRSVTYIEADAKALAELVRSW